MILTIASLKGGSGKFTLTDCITLHRKALAIDGDPQGSLASWRGLEVVWDVSEGIGRTAEGLRDGRRDDTEYAQRLVQSRSTVPDTKAHRKWYQVYSVSI